MGGSRIRTFAPWSSDCLRVQEVCVKYVLPGPSKYPELKQWPRSTMLPYSIWNAYVMSPYYIFYFQLPHKLPMLWSNIPIFYCKLQILWPQIFPCSIINDQCYGPIFPYFTVNYQSYSPRYSHVPLSITNAIAHIPNTAKRKGSECQVPPYLGLVCQGVERRT